MAFNYKTIFIPAPLLSIKRGMKSYNAKIDGISFSNDINAAIVEMDENGYSFLSMESVTSAEYYGKTYTEGMILLFKIKSPSE